MRSPPFTTTLVLQTPHLTHQNRVQMMMLSCSRPVTALLTCAPKSRLYCRSFTSTQALNNNINRSHTYILSKPLTAQVFNRALQQPLLHARRHVYRHFTTSPVVAMASADGDSAQRTVLVPVGHGSEEIETVVIVDVLRRAGAKVTLATVESTLEVTCSRGVKLVADAYIVDCVNKIYDLIACPGGMPGAEHLRDSAELETLVKQQQADGRLLGAICATPAVFLEAKGLLKGKKATVHPAFEAKLSDQSSVTQRVVVDGMLVTSKGPGTSLEFALSLVKQLYGEDKAKAVAGPIVMHDHITV